VDATASPERPQEGVVQYQCRLIDSSAATEPEIAELIRWRHELFVRDVIGCNMDRYGACYGNLSMRTGAYGAGPGRREFLVSCTQTGGDEAMSAGTISRILSYDHLRNSVVAQGPCAPSSESMTHGAIYDASLEIRAIVHGHDSQLWRYIITGGGPHTHESIDYGTPGMAAAARTLVRDCVRRPWTHPGVLAMAGHLDGVVAWGHSIKQATERFVSVWETSRSGVGR
jgi:L-ribulose-5-phosphate 4-epimerase